MYRDYESPRALERELKAAKEEYKEMLNGGADVDDLFDLHERISDLEERVNFAWQDNEYN